MSDICYNCFKSIPDNTSSCPYCGYENGSAYASHPLALREGSALGGRYIVGRVLGQGGFGITYIAKDHQTGSLVALKEYFPDTVALRTEGHTVSTFSGEKQEFFDYGKECFLAEAETLSEFIGNNNICRIYSYFEENGTAYFTMEYIEGESLQSYLSKNGGRITFFDTMRIILPVMDALIDVHSKGIVHRDLSPDNIIITKDNKIKLIDFGAARYSLGDKSKSLDIVLKHGYAPMEQYTRRGRQGPFTDVYSLAATIYRCITGQTPPDSIDRIADDTLVSPSAMGISIPSYAEDALLNALEVLSQNRTKDMMTFKRELMQDNQKPSPAPAPIPSPIPVPAPKTAPAPAPAPIPAPVPKPEPEPKPEPKPAPIPQPVSEEKKPDPAAKDEKKEVSLFDRLSDVKPIANTETVKKEKTNPIEKEDKTKKPLPKPVKIAAIVVPIVIAAIVAVILISTSYHTGLFTDYRYTIEDGQIRLTKYMGRDAEITTPSEIHGWPVVKIGYHCFNGNDFIRSVTISDGIADIGDYAFKSCKNLESVTIPEGITIIRPDTFEFDENLTSVKLPSTLEFIGGDAFYGCESLEEIEVPAGCEIHETAFEDCPAKIKYFGDSSADDFEYDVEDGEVTITGYNGTADSVVIPEMIDTYPVTRIGESAFLSASFSSVSVPDSVVSIGSKSFKDCQNLIEVKLPRSDCWISYTAFDGSACFKNSDNWDGDVLYIDDYLIVAKTSLSGNYQIKEGTYLIASQAFYLCEDLTGVHIPKSLRYLSGYPFDLCSSLTSIEVDSENTAFISQDNILYSKDMTTLHRYPIGKKGDSFTVPESVTVLAAGSFENCQSLKEITLPASVTDIKAFTFDGCTSLETVTIQTPSSLEWIGNYAFKNCSKLNTLTIPKDCELGKDAFTDADNIKIEYSEASPSDSAAETPASPQSSSGSTFQLDGITVSATFHCPVTNQDNITTISRGSFDLVVKLSAVSGKPDDIKNIKGKVVTTDPDGNKKEFDIAFADGISFILPDFLINEMSAGDFTVEVFDSTNSSVFKTVCKIT